MIDYSHNEDYFKVRACENSGLRDYLKLSLLTLMWMQFFLGRQNSSRASMTILISLCTVVDLLYSEFPMS